MRVGRRFMDTAATLGAELQREIMTEPFNRASTVVRGYGVRWMSSPATASSRVLRCLPGRPARAVGPASALSTTSGRRRQLHDRGGLMTRPGTQMDRPAPDLANRRIFITGANGLI